MHPRKEADGQPLSNASIFGGVKAVQEADNVMILQPATAPGFPMPSFQQQQQQQQYQQQGYNQSYQQRSGQFPSMLGSSGANSKSVQITKNRFDGELGRIHLRFNRDSLTFEQLGQSKPQQQQQQQFPQQQSYRPMQSFQQQQQQSQPQAQQQQQQQRFSQPPAPETPTVEKEPVSLPNLGEKKAVVIENNEEIDEENEELLSEGFNSATQSVDALLADMGGHSAR